MASPALLQTAVIRIRPKHRRRKLWRRWKPPTIIQWLLPSSKKKTASGNSTKRGKPPPPRLLHVTRRMSLPCDWLIDSQTVTPSSVITDRRFFLCLSWFWKRNRLNLKRDHCHSRPIWKNKKKNIRCPTAVSHHWNSFHFFFNGQLTEVIYWWCFFIKRGCLSLSGPRGGATEQPPGTTNLQGTHSFTAKKKQKKTRRHNQTSNKHW